ELTEKQRVFLQKSWPNPLSVILPCINPKFEYLHRGKKSLAFRMPKNDSLLELIKKVGPLVAPSANFEGSLPSRTVNEAKKYFGEEVAIYIEGGELNGRPSTLIEFEKDNIKVLRQG